jgi:hypothetical protein
MSRWKARKRKLENKAKLIFMINLNLWLMIRSDSNQSSLNLELPRWHTKLAFGTYYSYYSFDEDRSCLRAHANPSPGWFASNREIDLYNSVWKLPFLMLLLLSTTLPSHTYDDDDNEDYGDGTHAHTRTDNLGENDEGVYRVYGELSYLKHLLWPKNIYVMLCARNVCHCRW